MSYDLNISGSYILNISRFLLFNNDSFHHERWSSQEDFGSGYLCIKQAYKSFGLVLFSNEVMNKIASQILRFSILFYKLFVSITKTQIEPKHPL